MQIQKIQNNNYNTSFQSKFAKTQYIKGAFSVVDYESEPAFIKAVEKLLNDGRNDFIDIKTKCRQDNGAYYQIDLLINHKVRDSIIYDKAITKGRTLQKLLDARRLIIRYADIDSSAFRMHKPIPVILKQLEALEKRVFN